MRLTLLKVSAQAQREDLIVIAGVPGRKRKLGCMYPIKRQILSIVFKHTTFRTSGTENPPGVQRTKSKQNLYWQVLQGNLRANVEHCDVKRVYNPSLGWLNGRSGLVAQICSKIFSRDSSSWHTVGFKREMH